MSKVSKLLNENLQNPLTLFSVRRDRVLFQAIRPEQFKSFSRLAKHPKANRLHLFPLSPEHVTLPLTQMLIQPQPRVPT